MKAPKITYTTWNLKPLFDGDKDPRIPEKRSEFENAWRGFIDKWKVRNDYLESPDILKEALDEFEHLDKIFGDGGEEAYYFALRYSQELDNAYIKAQNNKIQDLTVKISNDSMFFLHNIAKIPSENQSKFLEFPGLQPYKHFLERLFTESKYLLSEKEEKILALKSTSSYENWVNMTSKFLSKEEERVLDVKGNWKKTNFSEIMSLIDHKDKKVRDTAAKAFNKILKKNVSIAEEEMNSILNDKKVNDELRGIERPDLLMHVSDDIDSSVVDSMLKAVSDRFYISQNYYKLKAKLFRVRKLKYHERNVEYRALNQKYTYKDAVNIINKVFHQMDPEFSDIFTEFVENGNIDVYPRKGKTSGAFCAGDLDTKPSYVLLNFTGEVMDVTTISHEMGHGFNNVYTKRTQNALNTGTPLSTAEVSSTFFENFVYEELMQGANDELKLSLMVSKLDEETSTIQRQVACYLFEKDLHDNFRKSGYLSKKDIGKLFLKHMGSYMGKYVEQSTGSENWWVYWSHIRSYFYVYSYANGLLISKALQNFVKNDPTYISKIKEFLSAGTSKSPKEIFLSMGIDISDTSFWNKGLDELEALLKETEALAKKLGRI